MPKYHIIGFDGPFLLQSLKDLCFSTQPKPFKSKRITTFSLKKGLYWRPSNNEVPPRPDTE